MTLSERIAARTGERRPCRTPECVREAIKDGAYCSECTNVVWSTGRPPVIVVPEWLRLAKLRANGLARDMTGAASL